MNNTYEIELDSYIFYVRITHYSRGYPAKTWALPEDCYPEEPEELEWEVDSVVELDEDGNESEVQVDIAEYSEWIEEKLLDLIHEEQEEDCRDYDYYDYDMY